MLSFFRCWNREREEEKRRDKNDTLRERERERKVEGQWKGEEIWIQFPRSLFFWWRRERVATAHINVLVARGQTCNVSAKKKRDKSFSYRNIFLYILYRVSHCITVLKFPKNPHPSKKHFFIFHFANAYHSNARISFSWLSYLKLSWTTVNLKEAKNRWIVLLGFEISNLWEKTIIGFFTK